MDGITHRFSFLLPLLLFTFLTCHPVAKNDVADYFPVTRVVDGDTFWVDDGSAKGKKIRLIGVDAPETRKSSRKDVGYYGEESKQFLSVMLSGKNVRLEYDVDRTDRYGRVLAYAYLSDGTFVNAELLKHGFAMVLTIPPNVRYSEKFVDLQQRARTKRRGMWKK